MRMRDPWSGGAQGVDGRCPHALSHLCWADSPQISPAAWSGIWVADRQALGPASTWREGVHVRAGAYTHRAQFARCLLRRLVKIRHTGALPQRLNREKTHWLKPFVTVPSELSPALSLPLAPLLPLAATTPTFTDGHVS